MNQFRGRRQLRPLFVFILCLCAVPARAETGAVLAHDRLGDITEADMALYGHSVERAAGAKKRVPGSPRQRIEAFSTLRILAASAETAREGFLDSPQARWGLWKLRTAEAYTRFMEEVFVPKTDPSPEEIQQYYQEHPKDFEEKGHIRFRSVFLDGTRCADEICRKDLEHKAREALASLTEGATPPVAVSLERFLAIASETTGQPTHTFEVRGPFPLGQIGRVIEKAALDLEPGQVGPVVPTKHGFQILRLESKALPGIHPLEEVRARIREALRVRETQKRRKDFIDQMLASGRLEVSEEGLAALLRSATDPQSVATVMLSSAFEGGLTVARYLDYLQAGGGLLRRPDDTDEKAKAFHRDSIQRFMLVPDLTYQEAEAAGLTTDATFQHRLRVGKILVLGNLYLRRLVESRLESQPRVTPEEIKAFYESHPSEFMGQEEYLLREIAARPNEATSPPALEFAFREAEVKVLTALQAIREGSSEAEVVKRVSQGNEAAQGGLTGWVQRETRYSPEIWKALSETTEGEWAGRVFRFGGMVVGLKVEGRRASERLPLSESTLEIFNRLERKRYEDEEKRVREGIQTASGLSD